MKKRFVSVLLAVCLMMAMLVQFAPMALAEDSPDEPDAPESPVEVSDFDEFYEAVIFSEEGDTIIITGVIEVPPGRGITGMGKALTVQRGNPTAFILFVYDEVNISMMQDFILDGAGVESSFSFVIASHNVDFTDIQFTNCNSISSGGAISIDGGTAVSFQDCVFDNNIALQGGHINISGGTTTVFTDCIFKDGQAQYKGGAMVASGNCTIIGSTFTGNHAGIVGGAICASGDLTINTTKFIGNSADEGGADIAHDEWGMFILSDNFETLTSIYAEDGFVPLGWIYDYRETPMIFSGIVEFPQYNLLKMKFQESATMPEEPDEPINPPSGNGGNTVYFPPVYTPESTPDPIPAEEPLTEPALVCGEAVLDPSRSDYLAGFADGASGRNMSVTRAQAVTVIFRLLTPESLQKVYSEAGVFLDVAADDWHSVFINTLQNAGIVAGCGNGLFKPDKNLTWGEMVTLFTRFTDAKPDEAVPLEHWSADAVSVAASLGWLDYHSGFNPDAEVTAEEFVDFASAVFDWATTP